MAELASFFSASNFGFSSTIRISALAESVVASIEDLCCFRRSLPRSGYLLCALLFVLNRISQLFFSLQGRFVLRLMPYLSLSYASDCFILGKSVCRVIVIGFQSFTFVSTASFSDLCTISTQTVGSE